MECTLVEQQEFLCLSEDSRLNEGKKLGRYHSSKLSVPGYGHDCWSLAVWINVRDIEEKERVYTQEEIVKRCLEHLNSLSAKKRYRKGEEHKPKYGHLTLHDFKFKDDKENKRHISALIITDESDNKHFWFNTGNESIRRKKLPRKKRKK